MSTANSEWPLPENWSWFKASSIGEVGLGRQRSPENHSGPDMHPYIRAANITWNGLDLSDIKKMNFSADDFAAFCLAPGDVLLNEGSGSANEVGKAVVWEGQIENCCFQNTVLRFRSESVDPRYACTFFAYSAKTGRLVQHTQGVNIFHIGKRGLEQLPLPIAPPAEQRRIVAKLDSLTARIARARVDLDRVSELANRLRETGLKQAFDGTLIAKATEGEVAWPFVRFDDAAEIASNLVPPSTISSLPHIAPNHIASGRPVLLPHRTIAEDGVFSGKHHFYPGQLLYSKIRPYLRKVVIVDFEGGCSADMYPINPRCHPRYLMYWMLSPQFTWLATRQEGRTVLPKINQHALSAIPTPLAPPQMQEKIAAMLDDIFSRADRVEAETARARALLDRLEAAILGKAFRGELVPQDPNDEPASVLLERIRARRAAASRGKRGRRATPKTSAEAP